MTHDAPEGGGGLLRRLDAAPPIAVRRGRNRSKADVFRVRLDGRDVAVKDYRPRPWWVRATLGRLAVRREVRAFRDTAGVDGVPALVGRAGPVTLATEWVDGEPLAEYSGAVAAATFDRLEAIVASLHDRGIALGDLHHRDVLVGDGGSVWIVDLATAVHRARGLGRIAFGWLRDLDRVAVARLRGRFLDGAEPDLDAALGARAARRWRRGRKLKAWFSKRRADR